MPRRLPPLANRSLETAQPVVQFRQSIHSGSSLRRGVTTPKTSFELWKNFDAAARMLKRRNGPSAAVGGGDGFQSPKQDWSFNLSRVLIHHPFKTFNCSSRSRFVKNSSKMLVNPLFVGSNQSPRSRFAERTSAEFVDPSPVAFISWSKSVECMERTSVVLVNRLSAAIIVPGADPWRVRAQSSLVLDRWHRNSSRSRSVEISSRVLINPMCLVFDRDSWSVDRCSFASDAHDHEAPFRTASRTRLTEYGFHGSSGGPALDPITHIVHRNSHLSRKEKSKATNSIADLEDEGLAVDLAATSFSQALK
nr:uncharacterized protein LOC109153143 isoform X2 [Ipomoea batatas]